MLLHRTRNIRAAEDEDFPERRPVASARIAEPTAREFVRWLPSQAGASVSLPFEYMLRLLELRKQKRIGIVFVEQGIYYISNNPADPWNSKEFIQIPTLIRLIEHLEAERDREEAAA